MKNRSCANAALIVRLARITDGIAQAVEAIDAGSRFKEM
jgi:hypothetical protein